MASPVIAALALGVALIGACDVSQKTPQTVAPAAGAGPAVPGAVVVGREARNPADMPHGSGVGTTVGDRSMRLYGPGLSRKLQTRI
ncbi:MAG TPA: hypothetical protein VFB75_05850 [Burkholderiales bacterium]|nr:hypothetical protein [Burkholderiales bacterium]